MNKTLLINTILEWKDTSGKGHIERLLWKIVQQCDYSDDLKRALEIRVGEGLTGVQQKCREEAWNAIRPLVMDPKRRIFDPARCGKLIRRWAKRKDLNRTTIYKYLRRYWQRGQTADALQPNFRLCGGRGTRHIRGETKLGKKKSDGRRVGINLTLQDEEHFKDAILRHYLRGKLPFTTTYERMLADHYSVPRPSGNGVDYCQLKTVELLPVVPAGWGA